MARRALLVARDHKQSTVQIDPMSPYIRTLAATIALAIFVFLALGVAQSAAGNCTIINGRVRGDCAGVNLTVVTQERFLHVDGYRREDGIILGARIVKAGQLVLAGISKGDILVEGGSLIVTGIVNGSIKSNRGSVKIEGIVNGAITAVNSDVSIAGGVVDRIKSDTEVRLSSGGVVRTHIN